MNKILLILLMFIGFCVPVFAENQTVLKSETGIIEKVEYADVEGINQGENQVKQIVTLKVLSGDFKGTKRQVDNMLTGNPAYDIPLEAGQKVILHLDPLNDTVVTADDVDIFVADIKRDSQLWLLGGIFIGLLLLIGRKKGVFSTISIIATVGLIFFLLMPMVLNGVNPIFAAILTCVLSTIITIYLVGGLNAKSTAAIAGTMVSLIFAGLMSVIAIKFAHLTGFAGEENMFLYTARPDLDFTGILSASMLIAALGALMDTSISIASTINEIHITDPALGVKQLFRSGMNVGRDIIGTMSNTLILVYMGSSLPLVLLASNIDLQKFFNLNQVATEIASALTGSIAILVCVPITAIISAYLIKRKKVEDLEFKF